MRVRTHKNPKVNKGFYLQAGNGVWDITGDFPTFKAAQVEVLQKDCTWSAITDKATGLTVCWDAADDVYEKGA